VIGSLAEEVRDHGRRNNSRRFHLDIYRLLDPSIYPYADFVQTVRKNLIFCKHVFTKIVREQHPLTMLIKILESRIGISLDML